MYIVVSSPNDVEPAGDLRIPVHHPRVDPHPDSPNPHGYGHNSNTRQTYLRDVRKSAQRCRRRHWNVLANRPDSALTMSEVKDSWAGVVAVNDEDSDVIIVIPVVVVVPIVVVVPVVVVVPIVIVVPVVVVVLLPDEYQQDSLKKGDEHAPDGRMVGVKPSQPICPFPASFVVLVCGRV